MIRRDLPADGEQPARWVLISQITHAHLAGQLAEQWGAGGFAPLVPRDELLWAIYHHDDGWLAWDQTPGVDPKRGQPRAFTEMEIADSTAIWSGSIETARRAGHLQGYVVAGHFCALIRRATSWKNSDPVWRRAEQFLAHYETQMVAWLAGWQAESPTTNTERIAARAVVQLQFFDALSLWFCCAEPSGSDVVATPGGQELSLVPSSAGRIRLSPWPFVAQRMNLEVPVRVVAVSRYASREALAAAPSERIVLAWQLEGAT